MALDITLQLLDCDLPDLSQLIQDLLTKGLKRDALISFAHKPNYACTGYVVSYTMPYWDRLFCEVDYFFYIHAQFHELFENL